MTATLTLRHREGTVDVRDTATVHAIAEAVAAHNRGEGDRQFRVRRSTHRAVRFQASQVASLNAEGIDLLDVDPFAQVEAVAA